MAIESYLVSGRRYVTSARPLPDLVRFLTSGVSSDCQWVWEQRGTSRVVTGTRRRWATMLIGGGMVVAYVLVRLMHIDLYVTTDEPFWLGRSANFYRALVQHDFVHTYQMAHPGVLTMWAGALAYFLVFPEYPQHVTENLRHVYGIDAVLRSLGQDPMTMLI